MLANLNDTFRHYSRNAELTHLKIISIFSKYSSLAAI